MLQLTGAHATATTLARPEPSEVSFREWVDDAHDIVLARVVAVRRIPDPTGPQLVDMPTEYEFSFETIERIKGTAPKSFVLRDIAASDWLPEESVAADHRSLGPFWLGFSKGPGHDGFGIDRTYLLFRTAEGDLASMSGREAQLIKSTSDEWLVAVKRLAANKSLAFGRSGSVLDLLTSAYAVVLAETTECFDVLSERGPSRIAIREQLWGLPVSETQLGKFDPFGVGEKCDLQGQRLLVLLKDRPSYDDLLRFRVTDQAVSFAGLAAGTSEGLIEANGPGLWFSQVELRGPLRWTLPALRLALRKAAIGETIELSK
ncbi:MAG: hypothetical protein KBA31_15915 [Alphaproteobacteria bacterium]|nr:hypothetical protein [Alphaproteobacteria bacterium]